MWRDPIVEEVRKVRDEYARRFNYDIEAIVRDVQARQKADGAPLVDRSAKNSTKVDIPQAAKRKRARRRVKSTPSRVKRR